MSAKELGQLHILNFEKDVNDSGDILNCDISGELSKQLQRIVRQGNNFKVVGIDMSLNTAGQIGGGQVSGFIRYYAPTKGRCMAYREAYKAMMTAMKLQGINHRSNKFYDFRAGFNTLGPNGGAIVNQATLNGATGLALYHPGTSSASIFDVHNDGVKPEGFDGSSGDLFPSGFNTMGVQSTPTDFVLNDAPLFEGNSDIADVNWEYIPFQMSWTPDSTDIATIFEWRPDPALYLAVMTGQLQVFVEEVNKDAPSGEPKPAYLEMSVAVMVSGWKSIMSDGKKKKSRRSRKSKSKSRRRGRK